MWIGVVEHDYTTGKRIGETSINFDNVTHVEVTKNLICLNSGLVIRVNEESMIHLLELIETK